ncbi:hypothetical protein [Acinetobacter nosocomialis]|uniref:hypothetical protein n=1 Tax=Acinetobacter nosocomialis TaxID=106654 RepID=UPI0024DDFF28|nr:hypothetical protein [Acinetobacter nosocomialis]
MVKHIELLNGNDKVVVDDQYSTPMLIYKGVITTSVDNTVKPADYIQYWIPMYWKGPWKGNVNIKDEENPFNVGFMSYDYSDEKLAEITSSLVVACRPIGGDYATSAQAIFYKNTDKNTGKVTYRLTVSAMSEIQNSTVEVCVYSFFELKPKKLGLTVKDANGRLIYDVMRPPMHFLGACVGTPDVWQDVAAVYNFTMPPNVDSRYAYLTSKSASPFFAAMKFQSSGINYAETVFKSVMSFPSPTQAKVVVRRANYVAGSSNAYAISLYFENMIYCPYPAGIYI